MIDKASQITYGGANERACDVTRTHTRTLARRAKCTQHELCSAFAYLCEAADAFVDHLHNADGDASNIDGHAQDGLGVVAGQLVDGAVEAWVRVGVRDVEHLARQRHLACDAGAQGKSANPRKIRLANCIR